MSSPFHRLPPQVIYYLKDFLSARQDRFTITPKTSPGQNPYPNLHHYHQNQTRGEINWRSLMNTSKTLFFEIKRETIYLQLNKNYSIQFLLNEEFRILVRRSIYRSDVQLGIDLSCISLLLDNYDLSCLNHLHYVDLSCTKLTKTNNLGHIHELHLNSTDVRDITLLKHVHTLDMTGCTILQLPLNSSELRNLYELDLSFCSQLTDVSPLRHIHRLNLSRCVNVVDVCALANVYDLNLSGCIRVTDVSQLGRVHTLDLSRCPGITDISALAAVHTLYLYNCPNIEKGLDDLQTVHELHISRYNVIDLSQFGKIRKLCLSYCSRVITPPDIITSASSPLTLPAPIIPTMMLFEPLPSLALNFQHMQELILDHCDTIDDLSAISTIPVVSLNCCDKIESINSLHSVQKLTLLGCERISKIDFLQLNQLKEIIISFCHGITEIECIGKQLIKCDFSYCDGLRKILIFNFLQCININDCSNLSDIMIYGKIGMLGIKCVQEPTINLNGIVYCMNIEEISNMNDEI